LSLSLNPVVAASESNLALPCVIFLGVYTKDTDSDLTLAAKGAPCMAGAALLGGLWDGLGVFGSLAEVLGRDSDWRG